MQADRAEQRARVDDVRQAADRAEPGGAVIVGEGGLLVDVVRDQPVLVVEVAPVRAVGHVEAAVGADPDPAGRVAVDHLDVPGQEMVGRRAVPADHRVVIEMQAGDAGREAAEPERAVGREQHRAGLVSALRIGPQHRMPSLPAVAVEQSLLGQDPELAGAVEGHGEDAALERGLPDDRRDPGHVGTIDPGQPVIGADPERTRRIEQHGAHPGELRHRLGSPRARIASHQAAILPADPQPAGRGPGERERAERVVPRRCRVVGPGGAARDGGAPRHGAARAVGQRIDPEIVRHPHGAAAVPAHVPDLVVGEALLARPALEHPEADQAGEPAAVAADPQRALAVDQHRGDRGVRKALLVVAHHPAAALVHQQAVGALRHHPPGGVLDQVELAGLAREAAGTARHLDDAEPGVARGQRGDPSGTAQPDRAGMVADQRGPAIRRQAGLRTEHDGAVIQPAERLPAGCPDMIVLHLDEVAGVGRRAIRIVGRRRPGEQRPHRQGLGARRMRLRRDAQQAVVADQQQVGAEHGRAMPVLVVEARIECRGDGGARSEPVHPVGEHHPDMAVGCGANHLDLAVLGQALGRSEPGEAQPVIAVQAVLGGGIQEAIVILRQRADGAVEQAALLAERAEGEALRRRRPDRGREEKDDQQDRPDDRDTVGAGSAGGGRGGLLAHAGHQT